MEFSLSLTGSANPVRIMKKMHRAFEAAFRHTLNAVQLERLFALHLALSHGFTWSEAMTTYSETLTKS